MFPGCPVLLLVDKINEPDKTGHIYGPNSKEIIEKIQRSDKILGRLVKGLNKFNIEANLIVVSDHGMREISRNRVIILDDYLPSLTNIITYGNGPIMQFDSDDKNIYKKLKDILHLSVYTKNNLPKRYHFVNENSGDYILIPDPGWLIFTYDEYLSSTMLDIKGMHGWDPADPQMHGIFIANGPNIKNKIEIDSFENIYIYGLITKLLGVKPYTSSDFSDGAKIDYDLIQKIIIK